MKKILYLFTVVTVFNFYAMGQQDNVKARNNHISVDPILPIFGTYQLQYERALSKKLSLSVGVGFKTSSGIYEVEGIDTNRIITDDFNFKGIKLIPEFRWYLQKEKTNLRGFYVHSFAKLQNFKDEIIGIYTDTNNNLNPIAIDVKFKSFGFGLGVGYKLSLSHNFYTDFIIAGPGLSFNTIEINENQPLEQAFYEDLTEALSNYGIFENIDADIEFKENRKSNTIVLPAFRYGIKIGYSF